MSGFEVRGRVLHIVPPIPVWTTAHEFRPALAIDFDEVEIDCSGVTYVAADVLGFLATARRQCDRVALFEVEDTFHEILEVTASALLVPFEVHRAAALRVLVQRRAEDGLWEACWTDDRHEGRVGRNVGDAVDELLADDDRDLTAMDLKRERHEDDVRTFVPH